MAEDLMNYAVLPGHYVVSVPDEFQGVSVHTGDGKAFTYTDEFDGAFLSFDKPIRKAVVVARLRALADVIEAQT